MPSISTVRRLATVAGVATLVVLVAPPALAQRAKARPAAAADADANYRLSMANIERLVPLAKNLNALQNDPDVRAYMKAKQVEIDRQQAADEAAGRESGDEDMTTVLKFLDGQPKIHQAFVSAGLTPRDYALTSLNLGVNWMAVVMEDQFKKQGTAPAGVAGANWTLVHQNRARIAQIMEELKKYPMNFEEKGDEDSSNQ